jgi:hypothetical protein
MMWKNQPELTLAPHSCTLMIPWISNHRASGIRRSDTLFADACVAGNPISYTLDPSLGDKPWARVADVW